MYRLVFLLGETNDEKDQTKLEEEAYTYGDIVQVGAYSRRSFRKKSTIFTLRGSNWHLRISGSNRAEFVGLPVYLRLFIIQTVYSLQHDSLSPVILPNYLSRLKYRYSPVPIEVAFCTEGGGPLYQRRWPSVPKEVALCTEGDDPLYRRRWPSVPKEVAFCTNKGGTQYIQRTV